MAGFGTELYWFNGPTGVTNQGSLGNGTYNGGMGVVADADSGGVSAFSFSAASSQYISLPASAAVSSGTIGFWMRTSTTGLQAIYTEHGSDSVFGALSIGGNLTGAYTDESMSFGVVDLSPTAKRAVFTRDGTDAYQTGSWVHVVLTCSNSARKIYVNGVEKTAYEPFGTVDNFFLNLSVTSIAIGRRFYTGSPLYYTGKIDDIRVLSSILTATNVSDWYVGGRGFGAASTIRRRSAQTIIKGAF
jgi:hypothetical protein